MSYVVLLVKTRAGMMTHQLQLLFIICICRHTQVPLMEKRRVLIEQHNEAKQLKEEIDTKQQRISEMLAKNLNQEQVSTTIISCSTRIVKQ